MPNNKQRRDAARRHLERQLERRAQRDVARKRFAIIASVIGTIAVIALVVGLVVGLGGNEDADNPTVAQPSGAASGTLPTCPQPAAGKVEGTTASFAGVTVTNATEPDSPPEVKVAQHCEPSKLLYYDLIAGKGTAATPSSNVNVNYVGVNYVDGVKFDSSWDRGEAADFSLTGVVAGFTRGIGGDTASDVPAMKAGGRRLVIMPMAMGYGSYDASANGGGQPNGPLVFVIDLNKVN